MSFISALGRVLIALDECKSTTADLQLDDGRAILDALDDLRFEIHKEMEKVTQKTQSSSEEIKNPPIGGRLIKKKSAGSNRVHGGAKCS